MKKAKIKLITLLAIVWFSALYVHAQTCSLAGQGYLNGTGRVTLRWFTQTPPSQIQEFRIYAGWGINIPPAGYYTASGNALTFSIPFICPPNGGPVTIVEVRTNGSLCSYSYSGNLPHGTCPIVGAGVSVVHSASYRGALTRGQIASIFPDQGVTFTSQTETARVVPLPTTLGGLSVLVSGQLCGLFFSSPGQINFQIPEDVAIGPTELSLTVQHQDGRQWFGRPQVNPEAPGVFTASANGEGPASVTWYSWGVSIYGTGIHSPWATLILSDGRQVDAQWGGLAPGYVGLWQWNFLIPKPAALLNGQIKVWVDPCKCTGSYDTNGFSVR